MPDADAAVVRAWRAQRRWSRAADRAKAESVRARRAVLLLVVVAAVAGAAAAATGSAALAAVSASATAVVAVLASPAVVDVRTVTRLRAVSEALKAEVHTFLAGADPYRGDDRDAVLDRRTTGLLPDDEATGARVARQRPDDRAVPAVRDVASYVDVRLTGQLEGYYGPAAARMAAWAGRFRVAQLVLAVSAAGLAGLAATGNPHAAGWIGALTTAATAVAAHGAAGRHEYLALTYDRTARRLESLRDRWRSGRLGDEVVAECETLLATQNDAWLAQWTTAEGRG
ncbi:DUF4231 domain-containing protein [Saccharothrix australiensis]|uniref:Uncharacterized protein DUF4231 n=1 Tax=Saccharothrix australiensis TaxID=2072 RepID=A0A495W6G8_9PSEU|nr:DUF4231 domain-containing protein [Saccharothrix australiensis]RKT55398.1 uncharacterized protein DUF4231 [Saccharothrix australiensis]